MFKINQLDIKTNGDVVYTIHWTATKTDDKHSASVYGTVSLPEPTDTFVPYEELTPEIVERWLFEALGDGQIESIDCSLAEQIEAKKNPSTLSGLPWA